MPENDDMTEGEIWAGSKEESQKRRWSNCEKSLAILRERKIDFACLNLACAHYRVGEYDFWPTTGKFIHRTKRKSGRGVFELIKRIRGFV